MILLICPWYAIFPFSSYLKFVFFLIHLSIKQFPGPISELCKLLFFLSTRVIFAIPPIFKITVDPNKLNFLTNNSWKIGVNGAPWPLANKSSLLKSFITVDFKSCDRRLPFPSCSEIFSLALWYIVWPWKPIRSNFFLSCILNFFIHSAWKIVMSLSRSSISFLNLLN